MNWDKYVDEANCDVDRLLDLAEEDEALSKYIMNLGAHQMIRNWRWNRRIKSNTPSPDVIPRSSVSSTQAARRRELENQRYTYLLFGGMPILQARRPDIMESIAARQEQIAGQEANIQRERDFAALLPDDVTTLAQVLAAKRPRRPRHAPADHPSPSV